MKENALKWLVIFIFWCLATSAQALALSEIELNSLLNQPLEARVNLSGLDKSDLAGLKIRIREDTGDNFRRSVTLRHEIKQEGQDYYVRIYTDEAVKEPVLTFTLQVDWPQGSYSRDYSLLIDPQ